MKITGTRSTITFDLENGFLLKAQGELLINKKFVELVPVIFISTSRI